MTDGPALASKNDAQRRRTSDGLHAVLGELLAFTASIDQARLTQSFLQPSSQPCDTAG
jgi:hypothetical protein